MSTDQGVLTRVAGAVFAINVLYTQPGELLETCWVPVYTYLVVATYPGDLVQRYGTNVLRTILFAPCLTKGLGSLAPD